MRQATIAGILDKNFFRSLDGFYTDVITVQAAESSPDSYGQLQHIWSDVPGLIGLPCRISPNGGYESNQSDQVYVVSTHTVSCMGYIAGISEKMRVVNVNSGDVYEITRVNGTPTTYTQLLVQVVQ